ncbi:LysR family transcriptional regulator [Fusibacter sp. 3D3]|uniref:LysR family transcriptional regulator n=1 Tax=Fusibacter sp. 3D3 TaxID=1048380 RepID=UPI000852B997|nr:LysR family transcriptional regulator [Fusibacter sp. 3D3]GAU79044.1 regulatory protein CysB [Fusibacter sp. 3D3]
MDSRDWEVLKLIDEEKSLTKTAQRLYISQPALTYRLNKLEKEFNVALLNRYSSGVTFTPQGEYLLKYAKEMLEQLELVKKSVQNLDDVLYGKVRIGVSTVYAKFRLAHILKEFTEHFPEVEVELHTGSSTLELPEMLRTGVVDLIIKRGNMEWNEGRHIIFEEPKGIITSKPVCFETLLSEPWIQDQSSVITESDKLFFEWWTEKFGVMPKPKIMGVNSIEACMEMISQGLGWTFLPKIHVRNRKNLSFYPLVWQSGVPIIQPTVLLYRKQLLEKPAIKKFIDYILMDCSEL